MNKLLLLPCILLLSTKLCFGIELDPVEEECEKVKNTEIPLADQINPYGTVFLKNCDAEVLYYGMGQKPDANKARVCAYSNRKKENEDGIYQSSGILLMLYANGEGVKRNIALAEQFACEIDFNPYIILDELKQSKNIDVCDGLKSGYPESRCAEHIYTYASIKRRAELQIFQKNLTAKERFTFNKLLDTAHNFIHTHVEYEVNNGGSGGPARDTLEINDQCDDFMELLKQFEEHKIPHFQLRTQNANLNFLYRDLQNKIPTDQLSPIKANGVNITQRTWIKYRNAWIEFAKLKYPDYSKDTISALLTKRRNEMLRGMIDDLS